ncbi:MAG: metal-dependent transcriptional regulator [Planctomycetota bacterium]
MAHLPDDSLSESLEDYLESILRLGEQQERVGTGDVAKAMGVRAASASKALKELAQRGLIDRRPYGAIELTAVGQTHAAEVLRKHRALTRFFTTLLGVSDERVEAMACHLEHVMPDDILQRVITFADYIAHCPRGQVRWHRGQVSEATGQDAAACTYCRHGSGNAECPALGGDGGPDVQPEVRRLAELHAGDRACLFAFQDQGDLHRRCVEAGFAVGTPVEVLFAQEGVLTLRNDAGQVLALQGEESAQLLVGECAG